MKTETNPTHLSRTDGRGGDSSGAVIACARGEATESTLGVCPVPLLDPVDGGSAKRALGFRSYEGITRSLLTRGGLLQTFLARLMVRSFGVNHHPSSAVGLLGQIGGTVVAIGEGAGLRVAVTWSGRRGTDGY